MFRIHNMVIFTEWVQVQNLQYDNFSKFKIYKMTISQSKINPFKKK